MPAASSGQCSLAADRDDLEFDELRLVSPICCGKGVDGPVDGVGKACGKRMGGHVACQTRCLGIGGGERLEFRRIGPSVGARNVCPQIRQHLRRCSRTVNGSALCENVGAMVDVPEPEAEPAQHEIFCIWYTRIAAVHRECVPVRVTLQ